MIGVEGTRQCNSTWNLQGLLGGKERLTSRKILVVRFLVFLFLILLLLFSFAMLALALSQTETEVDASSGT